MVRELKYRNREKFLDAAALLIERRGLFNMLPGKVLSVNEDQYAALVKAGLVPSNGTEGRTRGNRKAKGTKSSRVTR
jgi:hypothetical protein